MNGLSATFSSTADPGGFVIYADNGMFETLTGNVLGDPGPAPGANDINLSIAFSQNLSALLLDFATADFGTPSPLTITVYENSTQVGSATSTGMVLDGFTFPEGEIALPGETSTSITRHFLIANSDGSIPSTSGPLWPNNRSLYAESFRRWRIPTQRRRAIEYKVLIMASD